MRAVANSSFFIGLVELKHLRSSLFLLLLLLVACSKHPSVPSNYSQADAEPNIWPDYRNITVPPNIAPLNFLVDSVDDVVAEFSVQNSRLTFGGKANKVQIDEEEWHKMLADAKGGSLSVTVYTQKGERGRLINPSSSMSPRKKSTRTSPFDCCHRRSWATMSWLSVSVTSPISRKKTSTTTV